MDRNDLCVENDQKKKVPSESSSSFPRDFKPLLDFSQLQPSQFGISVHSFIPSATPKDKSRVAQLKARRRSSVGVRGSPETNSLIRFMAQQKIKSASSCQTPELVKTPSNQLRVSSTLKQKMASFQNLMDVEEGQLCHLLAGQDGGSGERIRTGDDLSGGDCHNQKREKDKENYPSRFTPPSLKRRRLQPSASCHFEMTDSKVPVLSWSLEEQEEDVEKPATRCRTQAAPPSCEGAESAQPELTPPPFDLQSCSPPENQQQGSESESSIHPSPGASAAAPALPPASSISASPPSAQLDSRAAVKKKKSVRFGTALSPEVFDKTLPPSTPLRRGGTPARTPTPGGGLKLRSALKTAQASEWDSPEPGAEPCSPSMMGASPPLVRLGRMVVEEEEEEEETIGFPSTREVDPEEPAAGCLLDAQPLNLNAAFHEESLSQSQTEFENIPSAAAEAEELPAGAETQPEASVEAPVRRGRKRIKPEQPEPECESSSEDSSGSSSRTTEQPEEEEEEARPVKRSSRSAAQQARRKMKTPAAVRRWSREVDRSLYTSRAYASKNPALSPIRERRSSGVPPPEAESESASCTDDETNLKLKMADGGGSSEPAVTETPSEDSDAGCCCAPEVAVETDNKQLGLETENSSGAVDVGGTAGEPLDGPCEEQTTDTSEASREPPLAHAPVEAAPDGASEGGCDKLEGPVCPRSDPPACPPSAESREGERQGRVRRSRRSSARSLHPLERDPDPAGGLQEEGAAAGADLAPWQADFNLEDVFKPVASRGQRSVRRSLRNQSSSSSSSSAGLAWLPQTPPDSIRRRRGRRLVAAPPSLSEET